MHHDLVQAGEPRRQAGEDPARQHFAGGIFQPLDVVEIVVIKLVIERRKGSLEVGKIHDPAHLRVRLAFDVDFDAKRMPVQARAFVPGRDVGQQVRCLELKYLENLHGESLRAGNGRRNNGPVSDALRGGPDC